MVVISADTVARYLEELDLYYTDLRGRVEGTAIEEARARHYSADPDKPDKLIQIDINRVADAIGHFKVSVDALKRLKTHARKYR